jgi:uncharacterized membrane protein
VHTMRRSIAAAILAAFASAVPATADMMFSFQLIDGDPTGINDSGQVVGVNATGCNGVFLLNSGGFTQCLGTFAQALTSSTTQALVGFAPYGIGINNRGEIVGNGVVREPDGSFSTFSAPSSSIITGINDSDQVVGTEYAQCAGFGLPPVCGLVGDLNGNFTSFFAQFETVATGINDLGQTVGTTHNTEYGWVRDPDGTITFFKYSCSLSPLNLCGLSSEDVAYGINNLGQIVGSEGLDVNCTFVSGVCPAIGYPPANGYIRQPDGSFTVVDYPGALRTALTGINDQGQVVGYFEGPNGSGGFIASPVPEPASAFLLGTVLVAIGWTISRRSKRAPMPSARRTPLAG